MLLLYFGTNFFDGGNFGFHPFSFNFRVWSVDNVIDQSNKKKRSKEKSNQRNVKNWNVAKQYTGGNLNVSKMYPILNHSNSFDLKLMNNKSIFIFKQIDVAYLTTYYVDS